MQTKIKNFRAGIVLSLAVAWATGIGLVAPAVVYAQDRSQDRRDDRSRDNRTDQNRDRRDDQTRDRRDDRSQDNRTDRTTDRRTGARGERSRVRDESRVQFTRSSDERRFDNGVVLRRSTRVVDKRFDTYFPRHYVSYPHYAFSREGGRSVMSPFSLYTGIFPPYVERNSVVISVPGRVYIDVPIYLRGEYRPSFEGGNDYGSRRDSDDSRWKEDRDLTNAVYDLEDTFRNEDIALLAPLTDPRANIAVFARGRYQYSVNSGDYLDMTRDFLRSVHTTDFVANRVHRKADGVYQVFAEHTYQDQDGKSRGVNLCFVVELQRGHWTITQVDSFPGRFVR